MYKLFLHQKIKEKNELQSNKRMKETIRTTKFDGTVGSRLALQANLTIFKL
jgi:hypothetical protein